MVSFQAYLDNIEEKTGLTPRQFIEQAAEKGFGPGSKSGEIVAWLAEDYALGRGHAGARARHHEGPQDRREACQLRRCPQRCV